MTLASRYAITRRLGEGASGAVYEAYDELNHEPVALKMLKELDARSLYLFKREFRALVDVRHKNLVELYELTWSAEGWFITMELVPGRHFLAATHEQSTAGKRDLFLQLARGLHSLHQRGLLHRDVKPSNVLVNPTGRVVIVDFGIIADLGRRAGELEGGILGTPAYMAPEQCLGGALTPAADWYAVGTMLFESLTGRRPFVGGTEKIVGDKVTDPAPRLRDVAVGVPADLEALCADLLAMDPQERPRGEVILRRLAGAAESCMPPPAHARGLVGREQEMVTLERARQDVREGRAATVFVHGTSGMGKSALVDQFLSNAAREGALILTGCCNEREAVPFKAFDGFMDVLVRYLVELRASTLDEILPPSISLLRLLFPVLGNIDAVPRSTGWSGDAQARRWLAFESLRVLLQRLAQRGPVILFLDDVQWGDSDSAQLLAALLATPGEPRVLTVLGYRSEHADSSPMLTRAREVAPNTRAIAVGPLGEIDAHALLADRLDSEPPPAIAARIVGEAGGNPFFLEEFARALRESHGDESDLSLEGLITDRVRRLDESARRMLQAVSLAGRAITVDLAGSAADLPRESRAAAERALRRGQFVRTGSHPGTIESFHDRVREAVVLTLSDSERVDLHAGFLRSLLDANVDDPDLLYVHSRGAALPDIALGHAENAAKRAFDALAFERAASRYADALSLVRDEDPRAHGWRIARADALAASGMFLEAGTAYESAAALAPPDDVVRLEGRASEQYLCGGYAEQGGRVGRRVLRRVGIELSSSPARALVFVVARIAWLRLRGTSFKPVPSESVPEAERVRIDICFSLAAGFGRTEPFLGSELAIRGLLWALSTREPERVARALGTMALVVGLDGGSAHQWGERLFREALALAPHGSEVEAIVTGSRMTAKIMHLEWEPGLEGGRKALDLFSAHPQRHGWERRMVTLNVGAALTFSGRLMEARELGAALLREARDTSDLYTVAIATSAWAFLFDLADDAPEVARARLKAASATMPDKPLQLFHGYELIAALYLDLYEGTFDSAATRLEAGIRALRPAFLLRVRYLRVFLDALGAQIALAKGALGRDGKQRRRAVDKHVRALLRDGAPWPVGVAEGVRATLAAEDGDRASAIDAWQRAVASFDVAGMALYGAAARHRLGTVLGGPGGEELVRQAGEVMSQQQVVNPKRLMQMLVGSDGNR